MAFNPYYPATYPYQQAYYQPQIQQMPPVAQQQAQPTSIIWVSGDREAEMYPVAPNNAVALWSQTAPVVYVKQADATGKPTIRTYDIVERSQSASAAASAADGKQPAYATKDELSAVVGAVKGFGGDLSTIRADIDALKADMYGIAGKKKAVKKVEAEDDS